MAEREIKSDRLQRTIGLIPATAIGLGAMLGAGIFVFPGLAGGNAGFGAILSFLLGGGIALIVALCTAELATAMPESGGGYFFISRSFGVFWGSISGLAQWVGLLFACAFYLVSFGEYLVYFFKEMGLSFFDYRVGFSVSFTLLLLIINILGTKKVGRFQNFMVISLTLLLVLIFSYGLIDYLGLENKSPAFSSLAPNGPRSIFTTAALIFTSYLGFVQIANIGGDIKKPERNLPRSLILSVLIACSLYTFVMFICVVTFSPADLSTFGEVATIEVARKLLGSEGAIFILIAGVLAALSSANASMISASRGVYALSKDKLISPKASQLSPRFGTPHVALIIVALPILILVLRDQLEIFAEVASFLHLIIYAGICLSLLRLRLKNPKWFVPSFRLVWGKVLGAVGAFSCLGLLFFMQPASIWISLGILVLASLYYLFFLRMQEIELETPVPPYLEPKVLFPKVLIPVNLTSQPKDLPAEILSAIPLSRLLLLGFMETPEQSESEQSEEEYEEEAEVKLQGIQQQLTDSDIDFDTEFLFSHSVKEQLDRFVSDETLQFILLLKPLSELKRVLIPIYDRSQVTNKLSTFLYEVKSHKPVVIRVLLFVDSSEEAHSESQLRKVLGDQLSLVHVEVDAFSVYKRQETTPDEILRDTATQTDTIVWVEGRDADRDLFLDRITSEDVFPCPSIFILNQ